MKEGSTWYFFKVYTILCSFVVSYSDLGLSVLVYFALTERWRHLIWCICI